MSLIKKQSAGVWIALVAAILALASIIVYSVNVGSTGYFQNAAVPNMTTYSVLAIGLLLAVIVLAQLKLTGGAATAVELLMGAVQIAVPVLLSLCLIKLIAARAEGLGFIYFSNPDVILEVQTPANLSSAAGSIANMVCLAVATVSGMVAAFFNLRKKEG